MSTASVKYFGGSPRFSCNFASSSEGFLGNTGKRGLVWDLFYNGKEYTGRVFVRNKKSILRLYPTWP
jgi:hypothetical protein